MLSGLTVDQLLTDLPGDGAHHVLGSEVALGTDTKTHGHTDTRTHGDTETQRHGDTHRHTRTHTHTATLCQATRLKRVMLYSPCQWEQGT